MTQATYTYPQTSFYSPVPPVNYQDQQPVNFCRAQQLVDQIHRLTGVFNKTVSEHAAIQQQVSRLGLAPLDFDAKPIAGDFEPNVLLPYTEMMKQMNAHKANLEGEIIKLAERTVTLRTKLEEQMKIRDYIAQINQTVPIQPTGCERIHRERVKHHHHSHQTPPIALSDWAKLAGIVGGLYCLSHDCGPIMSIVGGYIASKAVYWFADKMNHMPHLPSSLGFSARVFTPVYVN